MRSLCYKGEMYNLKKGEGKMYKFILLAFYLSFLFFTACSTDDKTTQSNQIIPLTQDSTNKK